MAKKKRKQEPEQPNNSNQQVPRSMWTSLTGFATGIWNGLTGIVAGTWNGLCNTKRWVVRNPGRALLALGAAGAAVVAWRLIQNNASSTTAVANFEGSDFGSNTSANSFSNCPVVIFYEAHSDKAPAEMMTELFPTLVENGYKTFLFEEPTGMSLSANIDTYEHGYSGISQRMNAGHYAGETLNFVQHYVKSLRASLGLLRKVKENNLNYEAMDMAKETRAKLEKQLGTNPVLKMRDEHMTTRIKESCETHGGGQAVLVGVMHNGIEQRLQQAGFTQVASTYIIDHAPIQDQAELLPDRRDNDIQLRTKNPSYMKKHGYQNVNIVNIRDNPGTNSTKEVLAGLKKSRAIKAKAGG